LGQASRKKDKPISGRSNVSRGLREGALFVFGAVALYLAFSLGSYHSADPGWSHSGVATQIENIGGVAGAWFADVCLILFGYFSYLFPIMVAYSGWLLFKGREQEEALSSTELGLRGAGFVLTVMAGCGLATLHFGSPTELPLNPGGILGEVVGSTLVAPFSFVGATLFLLALFLTGVTLFTGLSWLWLMDVTGRLSLEFISLVRSWAGALREYLEARKAKQQRAAAMQTETKRVEKRKPLRIEPSIKKVEVSERVDKERQQRLFEADDNKDLPPLSILDPAEPSGKGMSASALEAMSRQVELKLQDFGIDVEVVAVNPGPVITRFELKPGVGVKVSQISNLAKDLARGLSAISVRVVEVIPGKSVIGLEIPNEHREIVRLSETLQSKQYDAMSSPLALALGKDIAGHPVVADLAKMPHLLVAGTTGSGKSVAINAMILSILYKATPEQARLILIDPKMLELSVYEGIPHLLAPVVTDMKEAANALRWCVVEMDRRYRLMASLGVRNITGYNRKVKDAIDAGEPIPDPLVTDLAEGEMRPTLEPLPFIVVVIDELADMMMVVGKKVEELIARLAQKARASGIHLLLATQRPSVDVLTGLIKANIPTRIAFQVSSKIDSRTILDQMGAEQLLGHGDMLYQPAGTSIPTRIHGAFVDDHEVHKVVDALKKMGEPEYIDEVTEGSLTESPDLIAIDGVSRNDEMDPLYDQAMCIVTESRRASVSGIQRRLKIGYNRAARMVEEMERSGVVGSLQSNGSREVLAPPPPKD
jgi:S-DNA-T family DNA segregation ATPase FtsK/SpoIIIE